MTGQTIRRSVSGEEDPLGQQKNAAEWEWRQALYQFWQKQVDRVKRKLTSGIPKSRKALEDLYKRLDPKFWESEDRELLAVIAPLLKVMAAEGAEQLGLWLEATHGLAVDWALVNTEASKWARTYAFKLVRGINGTTTKQLQESVSAFVETPGMTVGQLFDELEGLPAFSQRRAKLVGTTEVTRAYAEGRAASARFCEDEGWFKWRKTWQTNNDDVVCPMCMVLHDVSVEGIDAEFDTALGPVKDAPLHPGGRCWTTLEPMIEGG